MTSMHVALGSAFIVTKPDQEAAIIEVQAGISRLRREIVTDGTVEENSREGESSSNGRVERAIQELQGLVRTTKVALEDRLEQRISIMRPLAPWLIKHAAATSNNYTIRESGKTSHELIKGRRCIELVAEFGELVFFRPPLSGREKAHKDSWRNRFEEGIWIGTVCKSAETLIATPHGVFRAGCIRRKVVAESWSVPLTDAIRGKPSKPVPESGD